MDTYIHKGRRGVGGGTTRLAVARGRSQVSPLSLCPYGSVGEQETEVLLPAKQYCRVAHGPAMWYGRRMEEGHARGIHWGRKMGGKDGMVLETRADISFGMGYRRTR